MEARLNPSYVPSFWELDEIKAFQPLCADILGKEQGISSAEVYGKRGQGQRGIDIFGKDINGQITVVGQCKCYEKYKFTDVTEAANEFYQHYQYWKEQGVTHFILIVACDISDRKIQDEINKQRKIFIELGIYFDAWSGITLRNKLMPYPVIAQRYIKSEEVVRNICGPTVQEFVFTPDDSIEITLKKLRQAMRESDRYDDIEELFIGEAKEILKVVQNSSFTLSSFEPAACTQYLQPLIDVSERLVRLSATLIKLDRQENFTNILIEVFKLLAQDPLKFESNGQRGHTPGVPEIHLYPLALMIYTIYIMGVNRKSTKLLQEIAKIHFKSKKRPHLESKNLPKLLKYMFFASPNTQRFFKEINSNLIPIPTTIKKTLSPLLQSSLSSSYEDAYWSGEFILSLTFLDPKNIQNYPTLFPSLYSYFPESIPSLEDLLKNKKWLKELFLDIENRLQLFDEFCIKARQEPPRNYETYEPIRGFCGNVLNLYQNS